MASTDKLGWVGIALIGGCLFGYWEEVLFGLLVGGLAAFLLCVVFD